MFKNEPRLEAAKDAALRGEAAEDHCKRDEVLCQWNATETANTVVENLAQTPSECVAALDLACGVQGEFDPLGKNARARSGDGAKVQSTDYNAVVDSSQARDLGCFSEESSCIVPKRVKLSASLPGKEDDDLFVSHLDCAGEKANESFEKVDEHQLQAGCSKVSPKKRHRRKRRRRARRAAKSTTRVKKGSKRWSIVGGVRRLSSLTRLFSTRLRRQTKRKRKAGCAPMQPAGRGRLSRRSIHRTFDGARECGIRGSQEVAQRGEERRPPAKSLVGFGGEANGFRDCCSPRPTRKAQRGRPPRVRLRGERQP
ncbi:hypothetical protein HPB52_001498 [Rhipicephalus sanguineus]|uniref:Uncharacterized protein n=1 Tax=Rhipicephalus sanguineus TaxID=34632 RepID=A0A9D4PM25_RHISA|nr:hypothetical protein HPB52_001498 [Rhipicephalus sanguineus]